MEKEAWICFKNVTNKFLGNNKDAGYENIIAKMISAFHKLGCLMNIKLHFLHSHLNYFPCNLEDFSEDQVKRFHQDTKDVEKRYQGRWDKYILEKFC